MKTLLAALLTVTGCDVAPVTCDRASYCRRDGVQGICERSTASDQHWCAFPSACPSGFAWDRSAGDGLANLCAPAPIVDGDMALPDMQPAIDGGADDGAPPDLSNPDLSKPPDMAVCGYTDTPCCNIKGDMGGTCNDPQCQTCFWEQFAGYVCKQTC